jgi:TPR repeat protein
VKQLARLTRDEYIRRGEAARAAGKLPEAVRYFLAVADHGDPRGPLALGEMARSGEGIERDAPLARDLLTRAAEMGQLKAMVALASMLRGGEGGEPDKAAALRWLQLAASRGDGSGQLQLAELPEAGEDAPKDEEAAYVWYRLAESALVGTPGAGAARTAAERVSQRLGEERAASAAQRVLSSARFRRGLCGTCQQTGRSGNAAIHCNACAARPCLRCRLFLPRFALSSDRIYTAVSRS